MNKTEIITIEPDLEREIDALARILLPEIQRFYETEEGQKFFLEWQKKKSDK